jgi:hypothetical protein
MRHGTQLVAKALTPILARSMTRAFTTPPRPTKTGTRVANLELSEGQLAQKPRPSGTIRTPNYPRLSSLAIAAALTACNGEVRTPMDGVGGNPDSSGGASSSIMGSTAGITVSPYGGQGGIGSTTEGTTVVGTGGSGEIGNPAGDMASPFGGSGSTAPEATGGRPPVYSTGTGGSSGIGDPTGGLALPFGGSGSTAPEAAGGTPDMGNPAGKMSPSFGGSSPKTEIPD